MKRSHRSVEYMSLVYINELNFLVIPSGPRDPLGSGVADSICRVRCGEFFLAPSPIPPARPLSVDSDLSSICI